jgi:hypothetical protein
MFAAEEQSLRPDRKGNTMAFVRGDISVLDRPAYRLANARIPLDLAPDSRLAAGPDRLASADLVVESGRVARIAPPGESGADGLPSLDLRDGLALPRFLDMHTHLDKGHIVRRAPNPDGTFLGARTSVAADREANWSAADVRARMDFRPALGLRARDRGDPHPPRLRRQADRDHLAGLRRDAAAMGGPHRAPGRGAVPYEYVADDEAQFRSIVEIVAGMAACSGA